MLREGEDYFVDYWNFPNYASDMFCVENHDGTFTLNLNARFTREQLLNRAPHEFRHIIFNHFQSDKDIVELEREAG